MKWSRAFPLLVAAALSSLAGAGIPPPAVSELTATYDIHVGGLRAGAATTATTVDSGSYRASLNVEAKGLVGLVSDARWQGQTVGRVDPQGGLTPVHHWARESDRTVEVAFDAGVPETVRAEPEFSVRPWSIRPRDQHGVTDPVTALVALLGPMRAEAACDRRIEAFDGRYRIAFDLGPPERDGDDIRCDGAFVRVAGYKPEKQGKREEFAARYSRRADGLYQVTRVTVPTDFGVAVMRLRD